MATAATNKLLIDAVTAQAAHSAYAIDCLMLGVFGMIIVMMQAGFAFLEAGSVRYKNHVCLIFKNFVEIGFGVLAYWAFGYGFSTPNGDKNANRFCGRGPFFMKDFANVNVGAVQATASGAHASFFNWFFAMSFAITATTIVSGAVAERVTLHAVAIYCVFLTGFIYPVSAYWGWFIATDGSKYGPFTQRAVSYTTADVLVAGKAQTYTKNYVGPSDFAGSAIVHMLGGAVALAGAIVAGPRLNWKKEEMPAHNQFMQGLGAFILWWGFLAFNGGSVLTLGDKGSVANMGRALSNTIMASSVGGISAVAVDRIMNGKYLLGVAINGNLSAAVAICCSANQMAMWAAALVGVVAGGLYPLWSSFNANVLNVDDPIDAVAVHFWGGMVGMIMMSLFSENHGVFLKTGLDKKAKWAQVGANMVLMTVISAWGLGMGFLMFFSLMAMGLLRESDETQMLGMDVVHHGGLGLIMEVNGERV